MKKNRFAEFFKGKGYYVLLFVGVLAIAAVAIIGSQLASKEEDKGQNYVDLNDTDDDMTADEDDTQVADNNQVSDELANNEGNSSDDTASYDEAQDVANSDSIEYEDYSNVPDDETDLADAGDEGTDTADVAETDKDKPDAVETTGGTLEAEETNVAETLSFSADEGLLWPVNGNVIMNYSMDHTIYHATLMKYACNPAIIIDAEVGSEVVAAASGVVSSIDADNEETGFTITMDIGDGFSLVYGQLDNVSLKVGDYVKEGDLIGTISEPTKYYTVEGSNLYFQVLENEQTVNPMLYLR